MGARGPGASRMKRAAEQKMEMGPHPWEAANLTRAEKVIAFCESLPITKGYGAGENVKLLPFQREWIEAIYAADDDGNRRVRTGLLSVARGQGKTVLAALLRSEEHTSELQSLMRNSYAVFCLKKKTKQN